MTEKDLWCIDCGDRVFIGKNQQIFSADADTMNQLNAFLLAHETTSGDTHRLVYIATSDVMAIDIDADRPMSIEVHDKIDA